jgi:hypothetical protein
MIAAQAFDQYGKFTFGAGLIGRVARSLGEHSTASEQQ